MTKLIALDLDRTLLNSAKEISPRNEQVLKQLHHQGIKVVLCTGRPLNAIRHYLAQLGLDEADDYTINFNGGSVTHNQTNTFLFQRGLTKANLAPLYEFVMANQLPLDVLDFEQVFEITTGQPSLYRQTVKGIAFQAVEFTQLATEHLYSKAVLAIAPEQMATVKAAALADKTLTTNFTIVQSQPHILEFLPQGLNKAVGLQALVAHFGWTMADVMAFGDADNDREMLMAAGDGVVMANGLLAVKAIADHETLTNDEDGVAVYLEQTLLAH